MSFDADVLGELQALAAGLDPSLEPQRSLAELTAEQVRHHLLRSLVLPPEETEEGRQMLADMAQEAGLSAPRLLGALWLRDGPPRRTWRLSVGQRSTQKLRWLLMREGNFIAVGRNELGDLSGMPPTAEGRTALRTQLAQLHDANPQRAARSAAQFFSFVAVLAPGDVVVAADGARAAGIGVVTGPYVYVNDRALAHRRPVVWQSFEEIPLPAMEQRDTLLDISHHDPAVLAVEAALRRARRSPAPAPSAPAPATSPPSPLPPPAAAIEAALRRKGQVLLVGPPGTGKTHWAERTALELAARSWFGLAYGQLGDDARRQLADPAALGAVEMCSFHPSFGYEDFIEGLRPQVVQGGLAFERRDGLFKRLCRRALLNPGRSFFLLIDEFNRGDVPRILGDLLAVLEVDRRGQAVTLPLSGERLVVPPNVFVLATMNTADRSTSPLDAALRRRFAVLDFAPDPAPLLGARAGRIDLGRLLDALNTRATQQAGRPGLDPRIGQAFFLRRGRPLDGLDALAAALQQDVLPALSDHFLGDPGPLVAIFGPAVLGPDRQRLSSALFAPGHEAALEAALLEAFPEARVAEPPPAEPWPPRPADARAPTPRSPDVRPQEPPRSS